MTLGPAARAAVAAAKRLPLGRPDVHGAARRVRRRALTSAAEAGVAAQLPRRHGDRRGAAWRSGGLIGVVGIRNEGGAIPAEDCATGQFVDSGRGLVGDRAGPLNRASRAYSRIASMIGPSLRPRSVSRYSTVGGLEGMTVRSTSPAPSRSRSRSASIRGEIPATASANSLKRSAPVSAA